METTCSERDQFYNYFTLSLTILGLKGGFSSLRSSLSHSMDLKNKCALMSSAPVFGWHPSRCPGCLCKNWEDKHIAIAHTPHAITGLGVNIIHIVLKPKFFTCTYEKDREGLESPLDKLGSNEKHMHWHVASQIRLLKKAYP